MSCQKAINNTLLINKYDNIDIFTYYVIYSVTRESIHVYTYINLNNFEILLILQQETTILNILIF